MGCVTINCIADKDYSEHFLKLKLARTQLRKCQNKKQNWHIIYHLSISGIKWEHNLECVKDLIHISTHFLF